MIRYHSLDRYLKKTFGQKVYKVSLNAGFTCPNRDGTIGTNGCSFCSAGGSGEFAGDPERSITEQIEQGRRLLCGKIGPETPLIAYFQAYTNTYAPVERLRAVFTEAISHPRVVALSIATRPDCLPEEVLLLLEELARVKPVWVELGLQSIHEETAIRIRRGYPLSAYDRAVGELRKRGIPTVTHLILGLPGEDRQKMLESVTYVAASGSWGIKLHLLQILKGTDMEKEYEKGLVPVMEFEEYLDLLAACLKLLPEEMVVHRLTGDGDKKLLVAPIWCADKKRVLNGIRKAGIVPFEDE